MENTTLEKAIRKPELLCELRLERTAHGVTLFAKSAEIEAFFRARAGSSMESQSYERWVVTIAGEQTSVDGSYISEAFKTVEGADLWIGYRHWKADRLADSNGRPFLGFLLCYGLKDGITLTFSNALFSNSMLEAYLRSLRSAIVGLYQNYIRAFSGKVEITYKESVTV